ncbi:MAG: ferredoxin family protein [Prolixibacteraceae bacterium]|nr:ferredoxin family protein [Prolixibacteraceae bacterium]
MFVNGFNFQEDLLSGDLYFWFIYTELGIWLNAMSKTCILFCKCGGSVITPEKSEQIKLLLGSLAADLYQLDDFCGIVLNRKDFIREIDRKYEQKIMVACYPRAIRNLLEQNDLALSGLEVLNFRELSVQEIESKLRNDFALTDGKTRGMTVESGLDVPAWYPVIDQPLCIDCGKCFKFCLFGVYTFGGKQLKVVNPLACKNNCPACGRNCPTSAIIFPRLKENGVLAGAEPGIESRTKEVVADSNLIATLNQRSALRRNIFRTGLLEQAEAERKKALEELKNLNKESQN